MKWTAENSAVIRAIDELKNDPVFKAIEFSDSIPVELVHLSPERVSGTVRAEMVVDGDERAVWFFVPVAFHSDADDETFKAELKNYLMNAFHEGM